MMTRYLVVLALMATVCLVGCETAEPPRLVRVPVGYPVPAPSPAEIKALVKAGVSDEVILSQIRNTRAVYRLSASEVVDLSQAGVSQRVLDFMINTPRLYPSAR